VLLARPLRTQDPADVQFRPGETVFVNFAVWDGGNRDRNGQKNVTLNWWPLRLQLRPRSTSWARLLDAERGSR